MNFVKLESVKPEELVDHLIYMSYRHNRKLSPEITPEMWARIFGPTEAMEAQFQQEESGRASNSQQGQR